MSRFGPTRGELWFRLAFSLCGLGAIAAALLLRGPSPAWIEIAGVGGAFFGGTALWTIWKLTGKTRT